MVETAGESEYFLLSRHSKKEIRIHKIKAIGLIVSVTAIVTGAFCFVVYNLFLRDQYKIKINKDSLYSKWEDYTDGLLEEFMFVDTDSVNGPITVNREQDDHSKQNIYSRIVNIENNSVNDNDNEDNYSSLKKNLPMNSTYFCQLNEKKSPDGQKGNIIKCPVHYTLSIDYAAYGRYNNDTIHCSHNTDGVSMPVKLLYTPIDRITNVTNTVREQCQGKEECTLKPNDHFFGFEYKKLYKYLHVQYHCVKDMENKKPKIAIVMFSNKFNVKVNSVYENAISEFYQYANIHHYHFNPYSIRYDSSREIVYMKLYSVLESLIKGLKEKTYDWIFWVDSDVVLTNPNIKLESFLPPADKNQVHFIASNDLNGLNLGVFFLRVHSWSLNLLIRALSYTYYHNEKNLEYLEQTCINNLLLESGEDEHYIMVPQTWFNAYLSNVEEGDFLIHLAGEKEKDWKARDIRTKIRQYQYWLKKSNQDIKEAVTQYYNLPKEEQDHLGPQVETWV